MPTVADLKAQCRKKGIRGYSKLNKTQLTRRCRGKSKARKPSPVKKKPKARKPSPVKKKPKARKPSPVHKKKPKAPKAVKASTARVGSVARKAGNKKYEGGGLCTSRKDLERALQAELAKKNYVLGSYISAGAHGAVYRAKSQGTGHPFVVKVDCDRNEHDIRDTEIPVMQSLRARGITRYVSQMVTQGTLRLKGRTTEWVISERYGEELGDWAKRRARPLSDTLMLWIGRQIVGACQAIHKAGWLFRDWKPENMLMVPGSPSDKPELVLIDYGLCWRLRECDRRPTDGLWVGSMPYVSKRGSERQGDCLTARDDLEAAIYLLWDVAYQPKFMNCAFDPNDQEDRHCNTAKYWKQRLDHARAPPAIKRAFAALKTGKGGAAPYAAVLKALGA
jgi:serine/threonine protein kinase